MVGLSIVQGDITAVDVGAIVNAANSSLCGGGGVDGAIHLVGGPRIAQDCQAIVSRRGSCRPGTAVVTGAGELPAGLVIHAVGPIWDDSVDPVDHDCTLGSCYTTSLTLAADYKVRDVAFPNISTGVYGFPKARAAAVAVNATLDWLEANRASPIEEIIFVCYDDENYQLYQQLLS